MDRKKFDNISHHVNNANCIILGNVKMIQSKTGNSDILKKMDIIVEQVDRVTECLRGVEYAIGKNDNSHLLDDFEQGGYL